MEKSLNRERLIEEIETKLYNLGYDPSPSQINYTAEAILDLIEGNKEGTVYATSDPNASWNNPK